ncbi:MAG: molybdopterin-dependent oxidoreductase [Chloroflexi bacterium]|nr:molybdopterin-dependent oxidoreductase [Chloroflexota bacterium]
MSRSPRLAAAFAGLVATGAAIATGELIAGILAGAPSPIVSVGRAVIALQPPGAKELVVSLFGTADKLALEIGVAVVALGIGAGLGIIGLRRPAIATGVLGAFVLAGFLAALQDSETQPTLAVGAALVEMLVGTTVLDQLLRLVRAGSPADGPAGTPGLMPDWSRRTLLLRGGGLAVGSIAAATIGRQLLAAQRAPAAGATAPTPELPATLPDGASLAIDGLTPIVVANADFYRIDTALLVPNIDRDAWRLRVRGMVDREVSLSYADLVALPIVEQYVTIACVSNRVGGDLVGNARWTGVRLRDVLDLAGVQAGATQLVGRSADGWTAGSPTAWVMDPEREPMIALAMNGEPLPREHGYPARVIIPGLYGYVSATKWVTELELTTLEAFDAYWVPLGWAKEAPILTQSRIDRPARGSTVKTGTYTFAGVAWAPDRGIARVEVQVDDAEWQLASLSVPISAATWVQWAVDATLGAGPHRVRVRATDATGETQTEVITRPDPNGARGWHTVPFEAA